MKLFGKITLIVILLLLWFFGYFLPCSFSNFHIGGTGGSQAPYCSKEAMEEWQLQKQEEHKRELEYQQQLDDQKQITQLIKQSSFQCTKEVLSPISDEAMQVYRYALYLNYFSDFLDSETNQKLLRLYRIAAMNGNYLANLNIRVINLDMSIYADEFAENLDPVLARDFPALALYVKHTKKYRADERNLVVYQDLRQAADWGNVYAQAELAALLERWTKLETVDANINRALAVELNQCAASQKSAQGTYQLAQYAEKNNEWVKALALYQQAAQYGSQDAILYLGFRIFSGVGIANDSGFRLQAQIQADQLREERYLALAHKTERYQLPYNEFIPDLNTFLPLPPAILPEWDGKIAFERERENNPPPKPREALLQKLAVQAGLDAKTGLPLEKNN